MRPQIKPVHWLSLLCLALLAGCGNGGPPGTSGPGTGRATFTVVWPRPTRLIPAASNSIVVKIQYGSTVLSTQTLARPATGGAVTAVFSSLAVGAASATAIAYPNADGTGVPQAQASVPLTIQANHTTAFSLTMASTIAQLALSPSNPSVQVGKSLPLIATATDAVGNVVLISAGTLRWQTSNGGIATVGTSGNVQGVTPGAAQITVTETESGKSAQTGITVTTQAPPQTMLVTSFDSDLVKEYTFATGAFIGNLYPPGTGHISGPHSMLVDAAGRLYVSGGNSSDVERFDVVTGAYIDTFVASGSAGLNNAIGMVFGPDGNLYVCSAGTNEVKRYNGTTGAFIDNFITAASGGLDTPSCAVYGPDGKLYVSNNGLGGRFVGVTRYDNVTGALLGTFVSNQSGGLWQANGIAFGKDGNLLVSSFGTNSIKRYDGKTGAYIDDFIPAGRGNMNGPSAVKLGPDGLIYVACLSDEIKRYDGTTGAFVDNLVAAHVGDLGSPWDILFR